MRSDEESTFKEAVKFLALYFGVFIGIPFGIPAIYYFSQNDHLVLGFWVLFIAAFILSVIWKKINDK